MGQGTVLQRFRERSGRGIGEKDAAEKAHDIFRPSARVSSLTILTTFVLKGTRSESNQQDKQGNHDERGGWMLKQA